MTGFLLFVCGTGGLVWAEKFIPSGVAALVVATEPIVVRVDRVDDAPPPDPGGTCSPASPWARRDC